MEPAAISARPAVTTMAVESMTPETPAARANGTVRPSAMPITMSRTIALAVKWCSTCGVSGMVPHILTMSTAASRYPLAMPPEATILLGAALVFLGFVVGTFGTLIGAGGGFLLVPLLLIGYHFQPPDAVGTSLALVFLNAASGSFAYLRQRQVDLSLGWKFAAATIPGAIGGAYLTRAMSSHAFSFAFGALLILIAVLLFSGITAAPSARADARQIVDASGAAHVYHVDVWKGVIVSFVAGVLSSAFGIGGGIIHVPVLIVVLGLPVHIATATSHFVLSISTLVGAGTFFALGPVDLTTTILMGAVIRTERPQRALERPVRRHRDPRADARCARRRRVGAAGLPRPLRERRAHRRRLRLLPPGAEDGDALLGPPADDGGLRIGHRPHARRTRESAGRPVAARRPRRDRRHQRRELAAW